MQEIYENSPYRLAVIRDNSNHPFPCLLRVIRDVSDGQEIFLSSQLFLDYSPDYKFLFLLFKKTADEMNLMHGEYFDPRMKEKFHMVDKGLYYQIVRRSKIFCETPALLDNGLLGQLKLEAAQNASLICHLLNAHVSLMDC